MNNINAVVKNNANKHKKPRILIVTGVLWRGGGAEKVASILGNKLLERGYDVHLLTFYEATEKYPYHGSYHTFAEPARSKFSKIWGIPHRIYKIATYIKQHKFDHAYTFLEEANFYALLAKICFRLRVPVVVSVRNNTRSRSRLVQRMMRALYPKAKSVVCVTKGVEEMLQHDHGLQNLTTIYNPIDTKETKTRAEEPLPEAYTWLKDVSPLFIHIGRHTHQKGQWSLLRAFYKVLQTQPRAKLIMIGDGPDTDKLQDLIDRLNITASVHLLGKQSNVLPFLKVADVAVSSSLWEGMPNTLLEALSVTTPIVATDCETGPREILVPELTPTESISYPYKTNTGTLTAPLAHEALYKTLAEQPLIAEEAQLAEQMLAILSAHYDTEAFRLRIADFDIEKTIDAWEELIDVA